MKQMMADQPLINRVANSGLITMKLEEFLPAEPVVSFDLKNYLFMEMILKEKDFRQALQEHDWTQYTGKNLAIYCSADAIIPLWAFMLVTVHATPFARNIYQGKPEDYLKFHFLKTLSSLDVESYRDQRIVIKGCSDQPVPTFAYTEITKLLQPVAKSIMFGEPCSTVPLYKRR